MKTKDKVFSQDIISLSDRETARSKISVFYGDPSNYTHGAVEVLMNARDEIMNNFEYGEVYMELFEDNKTIEILDTGRGIPLKGTSMDGTPNYYLVCEKLFASSNYSAIETGKISTGVNGVGLAVLAMTSEFFQITSYKNYEAFEVTYKNGTLEKSIREYKSDIKQGTRVKFRLDDKVYTCTEFSKEYFVNLLNRLSSTSNKVKYIFSNNEEKTEYFYEDLKSYMESNIQNKLTDLIEFRTSEYEEVVKKEGEDFIEKDFVTSIISLSTTPIQETYLNGTYLKEHGAILDGVVDGLKKVFNKGIKKNKITNQDILMSFNVYCKIDSTNPIFSGQTKFSTANPTYKKFCSSYIVENMEIIKNEQPTLFEQMLKHLITVNGFNAKNEESRKKITKTLEERASNAITRPIKLVPCRSKNPNVIELILIEGDSALNSVKLGRDADTMMVYPLKGKPMNVLKKSIDVILQNQEIVDIFKILGCGITYKGKNVKGFPPFDINKLSVDKILIATDVDDDGYHIQSLLIGVFYILAPELLIQEKVVFIRTPLYIITKKSEVFYAYGEQERIDIINSFSGEAFEETRFKGIGGLPTSVMSKALKHETRESIVVTMEETRKCIEKIELFLSDNVEARKKHIEENGSKYVTETLLV